MLTSPCSRNSCNSAKPASIAHLRAGVLHNDLDCELTGSRIHLRGHLASLACHWLYHLLITDLKNLAIVIDEHDLAGSLVRQTQEPRNTIGASSKAVRLMLPPGGATSCLSNRCISYFPARKEKGLSGVGRGSVPERGMRVMLSFTSGFARNTRVSGFTRGA